VGCGDQCLVSNCRLGRRDEFRRTIKVCEASDCARQHGADATTLPGIAVNFCIPKLSVAKTFLQRPIHTRFSLTNGSSSSLRSRAGRITHVAGEILSHCFTVARWLRTGTLASRPGWISFKNSRFTCFLNSRQCELPPKWNMPVCSPFFTC